MPQATISISSTDGQVSCQGDWSVVGIAQLDLQYRTLTWPTVSHITIEGAHIKRLDSAGAWLLQKIIHHLTSTQKTVSLQGFSAPQQELLDMVSHQAEQVAQPIAKMEQHNIFYQIGQQFFGKCWHAERFMAFIGELAITALRAFRLPLRIQWRALLNVINDTGFHALPIIALLSFLIGIVLTYQMGIQLQYYGANIYIVNVSGMAILREFGPLITAIIVAGRTGSAFTAQIGTMKVNEEVDALYTMGLSPIDRLVIPKILGLIIVMPLLTVWADLFGVWGGMVMAKADLGIGYHEFISRFERVVRLKNYTIGMSKAPIFALLIAAVGCFQGFQVSSSAESIGHQTTKSVVQAIFLIIIVDAIFSVMFSWRGI